MTVKEYLRQAHRLDQMIDSDLREVAALRELAVSVSAIGMTERVRSSRKTEAPYARCVETIVDLEEKIDREIDLLVELKEQIRTAISTVEDPDERMVLRYRYVNGFTWEQIGAEMHVDGRTARRWHEAALLHVSLPEEPIEV
jgi:DNA-directed RNA polymerase specialized sigma24 family protein